MVECVCVVYKLISYLSHCTFFCLEPTLFSIFFSFLLFHVSLLILPFVPCSVNHHHSTFLKNKNKNEEMDT